MFPLLFFLILTVPLFGLKIEDLLEVSSTIKPSTYGVVIKVETTARDEWSVLNTLSAVDNGVKALNIPYRGGYYKILPLEVVDKNTGTRKVVGFKGFVEYTFLLKDPKGSKRIFDLFRNLKANYPISYSVVAERWIVPPSVYRKTVEELKGELIEEAKRRALEYGKELGLSCAVEELRFYTPGGVYPNRIISPVGEEKRVKVTAGVVFKCQ